MTTKKQRREQVAAKRAAFDAETRRMGLEALRIDREKRQNRAHEIERAARQKANAAKMKKAHKDEIPDNLQASVDQFVEVGAEEKY